MATTIQKITLSCSRDIPFNKLVLSQANVRRVKTGVSIEELAEDIARRTLLQSLSVRAVLDTDGNETGMFEVPAGGRRFRALELLVKQKRLAKTAPVPCVVRDGGIAEEDSLAENVQRVALHPLDQFRAFQALREKGLGDEEIAARFFVNPTVVKQRLRLAAVSPTLLDIYAEDGMTLEQLMAFTVTADHARQEQVWDSVSRSYNKEPYLIRRQLTEGAVRASDRRALFVGASAYEAAGGVVMRDLFQHDDGGWLQDPALLDRLVTEKLQAEAEGLRDEGWKWIAVATDFPYGHSAGLRRLVGKTAELTEGEAASFEALRTEYETLEAEHAGGNDLPEAIDQRLGEIETAMAAFENRPIRFDPADISRAGIFVSIDSDGALHIERGFVRPEDEAPIEPVATDADDTPESTSPEIPVQRAVITIGGAPSASEPEAPEEDDTIQPLSDRLVTELTAHRTLALRDGVANDPQVAFEPARPLPQCLLPIRRQHLPGDHGEAIRLLRSGARPGRDRFRQVDRRSPRAMGQAVAGNAGRSLGHADGVRQRQPIGAVRPLRLAHRQRCEGAVEPTAGCVCPWRSARQGRGSRHGRSRMEADRRHLSWPSAEGAHPRSGAGGEGRALRAAHRPPEEDRDGQRGRTAAGRHRLAAGAAASRRGRAGGYRTGR